jgi:hypothetical protein
MKAFPILVENPDKSFSCNQGMDLRDYFAAKAMQKMIWEKGQDLENAKECYAIADAMMKASEK